MFIEITNKEAEKIGDLARKLSASMVPVNDVRDLLAGLDEKVNGDNKKRPVKRNALKNDRKETYKNKIEC